MISAGEKSFLGSLAGGTKTANWSAVSVDAPEWLSNTNIRYRLLYVDPTRVRFYAQDRWLASPPSMLAQCLSLLSGRHGWRLKITLLEFEQVFDGAHQARVILAFRALAYRPASEEIVSEKLFDLNRISPTADAKGAVMASAILVDEAIDVLQAWLEQLPGSD
jgi:cholesterol transport system auxiliary component